MKMMKIKIKERENLLLLVLKCLGRVIFSTYLVPFEQMVMVASLGRGSLLCPFVSHKIIECSPTPIINRGSNVVPLYYHMYLGY